MNVYLFIRKFLSAKTARQKKSFCKFNQAVVDHIRTHMKEYSTRYLKVFYICICKTCLNKFNMYILSELENMLHVVHVVLVLLPLLSVFFLKFKRFKLIHLRWPPAVRIKSCLLSYTFYTIWLPRTNFKWRYKNEGNSYHTRMKFVPKLPTKKLQTSITAFHCW